MPRSVRARQSSYISWGTAHAAVADVGEQLLIDHPGRLDGVEVIGVDEHCWRRTRKGDKYVTVIIDLTPIRNDTGPARLLDLVVLTGDVGQAGGGWFVVAG